MTTTEIETKQQRVHTDYPRLLVVSGSAPGFDGVDAVLQRQILEDIPRELLRICVLLPRDSRRKVVPEWVDERFERRFEHGYYPLGGAAGELIASTAQRLKTDRHLSEISDQIVRAGRDHRAEAILVVHDCPSTILIAERIARTLDVPLYSFVMDGPLLQAHHHGYRDGLRSKLVGAFEAAMHHSKRIATAGEAMQIAYRERYGIEPSILRQGLEYEERSLPEPPRENEPIRIGFAGSLTAVDAFNEVVSSLDERKWKLDGRDVIIRIVGAHLKLVPTGPQHIEYFGWRLVPDMLRLMTECHFLYMPQPFSGHLKEFAELSFPNKLCTYVPAQRPIILHTPENASLPKFFDRYPCGPRSTELDASALINQIETSLTDGKRYRRWQETVRDAFRDELNLSQLRLQVVSFLANK